MKLRASCASSAPRAGAPRQQQAIRLGHAVALLAVILLPAAALAQPASGASPASALVANPGDRTGTNPANLLDSAEIANDFRAIDEDLFFDTIAWTYRQSLAHHRLRAGLHLPMVFANVTGRTEAGFGDATATLEWAALARRRAALVAGADVEFDTSTNEALSDAHATLAPSLTLVLGLREATLLSVHYHHRVSMGAVADRPDVNDASLEASLTTRFANGTWLRAIPAVWFDHERGESSSRLDGEWGRLLAGGVSTWVRVGGTFGGRAARPFDWHLVTGIRFVRP